MEIKELLIKLKQYIINQRKDNFYGICGEVSDMWRYDIISTQEYKSLFDYIKINLPDRIDCHRLDRNYGFCWEIGRKIPRLNWINNQISKL